MRGTAKPGGDRPVAVGSRPPERFLMLYTADGPARFAPPVLGPCTCSDLGREALGTSTTCHLCGPQPASRPTALIAFGVRYRQLSRSSIPGAGGAAVNTSALVVAALATTMRSALYTYEQPPDERCASSTGRVAVRGGEKHFRQTVRRRLADGAPRARGPRQFPAGLG
jgi:hypothetical protein